MADQFQSLIAQAISAIHQGADPDAVNALLKQEMVRRGANPSTIVDLSNDNPDVSTKAPALDKTTKRDFADVVQGNSRSLNVADNAVEGERGILGLASRANRQPNSPNGGNFDNVEAGGDSTGYARPGLLTAAARGLNTVEAKTAGLLAPIAYPGAVASAVFSGDDIPSYNEFLQSTRDVEEASRQQPGEKYGLPEQAGSLLGQLAGEATQFVGVTKAARAAEVGVEGASTAAKALWSRVVENAVGGATPAVAEAVSTYKDVKDSGGSDVEAIAKAAKAGLVKDAMFVAPASMQGRLATRVASGAGLNTLIGSSQELADSGKITPEQLLMSAGTGAVFGALGEKAPEKPSFPKPKEPSAYDLPETDEPAFEAGKEAVEKLHTPEEYNVDEAAKRQEQIIASRTAPEQADLFTGKNREALQPDLLGAEPVEAATAEARRDAGSREASDVERYFGEQSRPDSENTALESEYIQDQQERLNQEPQLDNEPQAQADLWDVGAHSIIEDKLSQAGDIIPAKRNPVTGRFGRKQFSPANAAMAEAFQQAGVRRGLGLKDESLFPDIRDTESAEGGEGGTFEPSRNATVEQTAEQPELAGLNEQGDMFEGQPAPKGAGLSPYAARKARLAAETRAQEEAIAASRKKPRKAKPAPEVEATPPAEPEVDLNAAIADAEKQRGEVSGADGGEQYEYLNDDELPYDRRSDGRMTPKESVKPATKEQLAPFLETNPTELAAQKRVHDWINKSGDAHTVLSNMSGRLPAHLQYVVNRVLANPYAKKVLSGVKIRALSPEDLMRSTSGHDHVVRPILGRKDGKLVSIGNLGAHNGATDTITLRGAGFKRQANGSHGLDSKTVVHEILHGFTQHILDGVADGIIKNPVVRKAVSELDAIRKALLENKDTILKGVDPKIAKEFTYGLTNNHELMSVFYTDSGARNVLSRITIKGLSAISRIKNAVLEMLGFESKGDKAVAAQFLESGDKILAYNPEEGHGEIPGLEQVEPRTLHLNKARIAGALGNEEVGSREKLQKPRNPVVQLLKAAFHSKGVEDRVAIAEKAAEGVRAQGKLESALAFNRLHAITTPENMEAVGRAIDGDTKALDSLDPKAKAVVKREIAENADRAIEYAKEVGANPKASAEEKAEAASTLKKSGALQVEITKADVAPRTIFGLYKTSEMKSKWKLAQRAQEKAASGKPLSPRETKALEDMKQASNYLEHFFYPKDLGDKTTPELEQLYRYHTGQSADSIGLKGEAKRDAMIAKIGQAIQKTTNVSGGVNNLLKSAMDLTDHTDVMASYFRAMRRKAAAGEAPLPKALADLYERIDVPAIRVANAIVEQRNKLSTLRSQNMLREQGMGTLFTEDKSTPTHTHLLQGARFGPLQGLSTTPDVARVLQQTYNMNFLSGRLVDAIIADPTGRTMPALVAHNLARGWTKAGQTYKAINIIGRVGRYVLNAIGSPLQALSNGNIDPRAWGTGARVALESLGSSLKRDVSPRLKDMYKYGQLEYSWIQELKGSEKGAMLTTLIRQAAQADDALGTFRKSVYQLQRTGQISAQTAKEFYGIMDWWTKAANFYHKLDVWTGYNARHDADLAPLTEKYGISNVKKMLANYDEKARATRASLPAAEKRVLEKKEEQIKQLVAERNNNTNITPSMAPKAVRAAESLLNSYLTYFFEIPRTLYNSVAYGAKDAYKGLASKDAQLATHGMLQIMGTALGIYGIDKLGALAGKTAAGLMGLSVADLPDSDDRKKYMDSDPYLSSMDPILLKDPQHPEAGEYTMDTAGVDPYAPMTHPPKAMAEAVMLASQGKTEEAKQKMDVAYQGLMGMILRNPLYAAGVKIARGTPPKMAKENPDLYAKWHGWLVDEGLDTAQANGVITTIETSFLGSAKDLLSARGSKSPRMAKLQAAGIGVQPLDVAQTLSSYLGRKAKGDIDQARAGYLSMLKNNYEANPERVKEEFSKSLKKIVDPYRKLQLAVNAAKAQGADDAEIVSRLKTANVSSRLIGGLLNGEKVSPLLLMGDLKKDMLKDIADNYGNSDEQDKAINRYAKHNEIMADLVSKYLEENE